MKITIKIKVETTVESQVRSRLPKRALRLHSFVWYRIWISSYVAIPSTLKGESEIAYEFVLKARKRAAGNTLQKSLADLSRYPLGILVLPADEGHREVLPAEAKDVQANRQSLQPKHSWAWRSSCDRRGGKMARGERSVLICWVAQPRTIDLILSHWTEKRLALFGRDATLSKSPES